MRFWRQCIVSDTIAPPIRWPYNQFEVPAVTFLELASLLASAATIFGLIVGVFSVWNGRMARREIGTLIAHEDQATREIIVAESRATRYLIARESGATRELMEGHQQAAQQILARLTDILGRIDARVR